MAAVWALTAARAGARHVWAVEVIPEAARHARQVIAAAGQCARRPVPPVCVRMLRAYMDEQGTAPDDHMDPGGPGPLRRVQDNQLMLPAGRVL